MRGLLLPLVAVIGLALGAQPALAHTCAPESATEIERRGDVAATGTVETQVPLGFIFSADHVYKGNAPAHVLVLGQYIPPDAGTRFFAVMRFHLPGIYSMDICDGRPIGDATLGVLGDSHSPSADLPVIPVAVGSLLLLLLFVSRRNRGKPAAPATATAY